MVREIHFLATSNLTSELKKLKKLNESTVIEVLQSYLKRFDDQTPTAAGTCSKKISHTLLSLTYLNCY
jgi:hypothetical protein